MGAYLLDTHALIWWLSDPQQLSPSARKVIADPAHMIMCSAASAWEMSIKQRLGRLEFPSNLEEVLEQNQIESLPISIAHTLGTGLLPMHHQDPFDRILTKLGPDEFIDMGVEIALQHHEKWDGTGYPFGLSGTEISLAARIVALADFYDAVTSKRVYKEAMSHEDTSNLIRELRGSHFDPEVADAFFTNEREFNVIRAHNQQEDVNAP